LLEAKAQIVTNIVRKEANATLTRQLCLQTV